MEHAATVELRAMLVRLASCRMGQLLLRVAVDRRLTIRFGTEDELHTPRGAAGGMYVTHAKVILLKRRSPRDYQLLTLAHELQHFVDDMFGWAGTENTIDNEVRANHGRQHFVTRDSGEIRCVRMVVCTRCSRTTKYCRPCCQSALPSLRAE